MRTIGALSGAARWALEEGYVETDIALAAGEKFYDVLSGEEIDLVVAIARDKLEAELVVPAQEAQP